MPDNFDFTNDLLTEPCKWAQKAYSPEDRKMHLKYWEPYKSEYTAVWGTLFSPQISLMLCKPRNLLYCLWMRRYDKRMGVSTLFWKRFRYVYPYKPFLLRGYRLASSHTIFFSLRMKTLRHAWSSLSFHIVTMPLDNTQLRLSSTNMFMKSTAIWKGKQRKQG